MSGLVKAKKYDWKDSNLALFGSDTEKQVKKESAECEPAWQGAGQEVGLKIWRIVKFEVTDWPEQDYGKFYNGDSYIILNTYHPTEESEALEYDVHFWIGAESSQDEYGTAAYKTVELDTFLDDKAVQHRETQNHESELFRTYFKSGISFCTTSYQALDLNEVVVVDFDIKPQNKKQILKSAEGGAATGFRHVTPEEYKKRLLHFSGTRKTITIKEVPCQGSLTSNDVFILDLGLKFIQWNGSACNKDERFKAAQFLQQLESERGKAESETIDEAEEPSTHQFYQELDGEDEDDEDAVDEASTPELFRISDADGSIGMDSVKQGDVSIDDFVQEDVFLLDIGTEVFVWVGGGASEIEKKNGMTYAHNYLKDTGHPYSPISVIKEGTLNTAFNLAVGVSDASGFLQFAKMKDGGITRDDFDSKDVFMLDTSKELFVWVGNGASPTEKKNGFGYAHKHLAKSKHPMIPIVVVKEGQKNADFIAAVGAAA